MTEMKCPDTYGHVSRIAFSPEAAELRLSPFSFSRVPGETCVLSVRFEAPKFSEEQLRACLGEEFEIVVHSDHVCLTDPLDGNDVVLAAAAIHVRSVAYDAIDYCERLSQIEEALEEQGNRLVRARRKVSRMEHHLGELRRRADLKAGASEEQRVRQAAAIEVLNQLRTHLDED